MLAIACNQRELALGRAQCITDKLTLNPSAIESYWGDDNVSNGKIALVFSYLAFRVFWAAYRMLGGQGRTCEMIKKSMPRRDHQTAGNH